MANKIIKYGIGFEVDNSGLKEVQNELNKIYGMTLKDFKLIDPKATKADLDQVKQDAMTLGKALEDSFNPKTNSLNITKFQQSIQSSGESVKDLGQRMLKAGQNGATAFRNMTAEILTVQRETRQTAKWLDDLGKTFVNTVRWSISSSALNLFTGSIQKAWSFAQRLDESLNNIRIVTGKSAEDMEKFAKQANKAAKGLGASTTAYTNASLIYYQQGLGEKDVKTRTETTLKAANVTGQSAAEVSEQLTAVWNGYKVVAEEAENYVDKLAAVAATTAADLEELSTGMSKVASAANAMGVNIDQLSAQLATIVSVTRQDASVVGTALKTIYARMGDLQVDGVDEFGTKLGDVSGKMRQMGIEVTDQQGNLRDMGAVIEEVAKKWGTWTAAQQQAAAVAMAGKRQYNNLIALFENWDMYESALTTSQTSAGTLQKQQDIYMDSIEARLQELGTAGEKVYDAFIDSESMKDFLSIITDIVDKVAIFIKSIGGGGNLLLGLGSILTTVFSGNIAKEISRITSNFGLFKQKLQDNRIEADLRKQFEGIEEKSIQKMIELKKEQLKYGKLLTEEEKEEYDALIKQTAERENQLKIAEEEQRRAEKQYEEDFGKFIKDGAGQYGESQAWGNDSASNREKAVEDYENRANELNTQIEQGSVKDLRGKKGSYISFQRQLRATKGRRQDSEKAQKKGNAEEIKNAIDIEVKANERLSQSIKNLSEDELLNASAKKKVIEVQRLFEEGVLSLEEVEEKISEILQETSNEYSKQAKAIMQTKDATDKLVKAQEDQDKAQKRLQQLANFKSIVSGVTQLIGGLGQAAAAINILKSSFSVFSDETLTLNEKIEQFASGIASLIPIFIALIPVMVKFFKGMHDGFSKAQKAAGWIGIAITAAILLIQIVGTIGNHFGWWTSESEKLQQALEEEKKTLEDLQNNLKNVQDQAKATENALSNLDKIRNTFKDLTIGSEEWNKALAENNQQILELTKNNPELFAKDFIKEDENGMLTLSQEGEDYLNEKNKNLLNASQAAVYSQQAEVLRAQEKVNINDFINKMTDEIGSKVIIHTEEAEQREDTEDLFEQILSTATAKDFLSDETFEKYLKDLGVTNESLIDTLTENKESIRQQIESTKANTAAIDAYTKQFVATYFANDENRQSSASTNAWDKLMSKKVQARRKEIEDEEANETTDKDSWYDKNIWYAEKGKQNWQDSAIEAYARYRGVEKSQIEVDEDDGLRVKGETNWTSVDSAKEIVLNQLIAEEIQSEGKGITDFINDVSYNSEMGSEWLNFAGGSGGSFSETGFTGEELAKFYDKNGNINNDLIFTSLKKSAEAAGMTVEKFVQNLGYEGYGAQGQGLALDFIREAIANEATTRKEIFDNYNLGTDSINTNDYKALSKEQLRLVAGAMDYIQRESGTSALESFNTFLSSGDYSAEEQAKIAELAKNIDFNDVNAINKFRALLEENGINIDLEDTSWTNFVEKIEKASDATGNLVAQFATIRNELKEISKIVSDLSAGDTLSDEDYNKLITSNPELKKYFMATVDGYEYLGGLSSNELKKRAFGKYSSLDDIKSDYNAVNNAGAAIFGEEGSETNQALTIKNAGSNAKTLKDWYNRDVASATTLLNAASINSEAFLKDIALIQDPKIDSSSSAYKDAAENLEKYISAINSVRSTYNAGGYSADTATEQYFSAVSTGNYNKDIQLAQNLDPNGELSKQVKQKYQNQWQEELGLDGVLGFGFEEIKDLVESARKLELDYLKVINKEITKMSIELERAFGKDKLDILEKQIEKEKEAYAISLDATEQYKKSFNEAYFKKDTLDQYKDLDFLQGKTFETLTSEDINQINDLLTGTKKDSELYKFLTGLLNGYDTIVNKENEAVEAQNRIFDLQIEAYKAQKEQIYDLIEASKKLLEFSQKFKDYSTGDLDVFGPQSAADMINNAFDMIKTITNEAAYAVKQANLESFILTDELQQKIKEKQTAVDDVEDSLLKKEKEIENQEAENITNLAIKEKAVKDANKKREEAQNKVDFYKAEEAAVEAEYLEAQNNTNAIKKIAQEKQTQYDDIVKRNQRKKDREGRYKDASLAFAEYAVNNTPDEDYFKRRAAYLEWRETKTNLWNFSNKDEEAKRKLYLTWTGGEEASGEDSFLAEMAINDLTRAALSRNIEEADITNYLEWKEELGEDYFTDFESNFDFNIAELLQGLTLQELADEAIAKIALNVANEKVEDAEAEEEVVKNKEKEAEKIRKEAEKELNIEKETLLQAKNDLKNFRSSSALAIEVLKKEYTELEFTLKEKQDDLTNFIKDNPFIQLNQEGEAIFNSAAFEENWDEAISKAQTSLESFQEQLKTLYDGYLQAQDELVSLYDTEIEKLSTINSILTTSSDLWKIIGKNLTDTTTSSLNIANNYARITTETAKSYSLAQTKLAMIQNEYDKLLLIGDSASEEQLTKLRENLATATQEVMENAQSWMTAISTEFSEKMSLALNDFVKEATGLDIDGITEEWSLYKNEENRYLDDVNSIYEIEKLTRNFEKSIDETDNIAAQNKLNKVMQEQLNILKEKDKLSQYDLDRANAMYELTLKQIALEEAQQTANKMKLTRDVSGNYTYQYVADQDKIAEAEAALAEAENNLYNMDKDRTSELVENYYSTMTEAEGAIAEAMAAGDLERVERLKKYYFDANDGLLAGIQRELGIASENLNGIGQGLMGAEWTSSLEEFSDAIINSNLSELASSVETIIANSSALMSSAITQMETLLGDNGPISENLNYLTAALKSPDQILTETAKISQATTNVLTQLPPLTTLVGNLANNLETYGEKYQNWLKNNVNTTELSSNTDATKKLTDATDALREAFEDGLKGTFTLSDGTEININFDQATEEN